MLYNISKVSFLCRNPFNTFCAVQASDWRNINKINKYTCKDKLNLHHYQLPLLEKFYLKTLLRNPNNPGCTSFIM